jgi:hypothetical protein
MNGSDGGVPAEGKFFRILSLDGGGIRGVFPAALLARFEEHLEHPIGRYFDLIAGTSTGGIIAIGLGLGQSAGDILNLYVEHGRAIFDQEHGAAENWVRQKLRGMAHLLVTKHSSKPLRLALEGVLGRRKLGESRTRLVIPAWHPVLERVYIYKTAHHPRLETDYKERAIDAAMATAAAPTFLKPHMTVSAVELVDGGVWANNPIGVAAIEAVGMLGWPGEAHRRVWISDSNEAEKPLWIGALLGPVLADGHFSRSERVRHRGNPRQRKIPRAYGRSGPHGPGTRRSDSCAKDCRMERCGDCQTLLAMEPVDAIDAGWLQQDEESPIAKTGAAGWQARADGARGSVSCLDQLFLGSKS